MYDTLFAAVVITGESAWENWFWLAPIFISRKNTLKFTTRWCSHASCWSALLARPLTHTLQASTRWPIACVKMLHSFTVLCDHICLCTKNLKLSSPSTTKRHRASHMRPCDCRNKKEFTLFVTTLLWRPRSLNNKLNTIYCNSQMTCLLPTDTVRVSPDHLHVQSYWTPPVPTNFEFIITNHKLIHHWSLTVCHFWLCHVGPLLVCTNSAGPPLDPYLYSSWGLTTNSELEWPVTWVSMLSIKCSSVA